MSAQADVQAAADIQAASVEATMDGCISTTGTAGSENTAQPTKRKAFSRYFAHLNMLIRVPSRFYAELPQKTGYTEALVFLITSSVFFTAVSFTYLFNSDVRMIPVILINSLGMPFIAGALGWATLVMFFGKQVGGYARVFSIFAYAAGAVMLVSWIPALGWATEIWRLILVCIGLHRAYQLGWKKSFFVTVASTVVLTMFFWSTAPVISSLKALL